MTTPTTERPPASAGRSLPRLQQRYRNEIVPALRDEFKIANVMQTPNLVKIVVNMGVGEAARDSKLIWRRSPARSRSSPGRANPSRSSSCGKA